MIKRATKLRWRRKLRRGQYRAKDMTQNADEHLEKHFIKRVNRLLSVKRFALGWVFLVSLLIVGLVLQIRYLAQYHQALKPTPGGIYTEGMLGSFTNASPIYATDPIDVSVSKLVFSGLLRYDQNNQLANNLAESWSLNENETLYTVKLRPNLKWHDGQPLTSTDVVFTFRSIQTPDAKSPLFNSWQGIVVEAKDDLTVTFLLPSVFSPFPHSLTTGIAPKHLLESIPPAQLRSAPFNTTYPVGSGPFKWQAIEATGTGNVLEREQRIGLVPYENYHLGPPLLSQLIVRTFQDERELITNLENKTINAAVGLNAVPDEIKNDLTVTEYNIPLTGAVFSFFNNSREPLNDAAMRRALVLAANNKEVVGNLGFPAVIVNAALLKDHLGYSPDLAQPGHNLEEANKLLDSLGWLRDSTSGLRVKGDRKLTLKLFSENTVEYAGVTQILQKQWREAGIETEVTLEGGNDLQTTIASHDYDILVYAVSIGTDPDVFAYWHSSQADTSALNHLNLSEYKSSVADRSLEAGRTRSDPALRVVKYRPFLEAWKNDNPAMALYQPRFLYLVREPFFNFNPTVMNQRADRFSNVHNWMVREAKAQK